MINKLQIKMGRPKPPPTEDQKKERDNGLTPLIAKYGEAVLISQDFWCVVATKQQHRRRLYVYSKKCKVF